LFRTSPECKLTTPDGLDPPGYGRWRLVDSVGASFLIAVMQFRADEPGTRRTAMIAWDSDLVHLVENPHTGATIHSLHQVVSPQGESGEPVAIREISEVWRGVDHACADAEVIIFQTAAGSRFCGTGAIEVPASVRQDALIARVLRCPAGDQDMANSSPDSAP
jgi:hypothetical protein